MQTRLRRAGSARWGFLRQRGASVPLCSSSVRSSALQVPTGGGGGTLKMKASAVPVDDVFQNSNAGSCHASDIPFPSTFPLWDPAFLKEQYLAQHGCCETQKVVRKGPDVYGR